MRFPLAMSAGLSAYIAKHKLARTPFVPVVLMLEPLFACNLTCGTCGRIREYRDRVTEMMSFDDCLAAARECPAPVVSICGGEPLIYPAIGELTVRLALMGRWVYLCTNGTLLLQSLDRLRPSARLMLNVHIDGPRDVHDMIVERPGAYDLAIEGIREAVSRGFRVTVNTTICRETDMDEIEAHMSELDKLGVWCHMLSPAYSYTAVDDKEHFMGRADVHAKFRGIKRIADHHRLADTPVYLEFLMGQRELRCTAWGNPTRNPAGWRSPCYLLADHHYGTYQEMVEKTDWDAYGRGNDPRCEDCMVHCGFEPTVALMLDRRRGDVWRMIRWQLFG